jgi:hypothetical protein
MANEPYRAGDTVSVPALSETWVLACDERDGYVYPAGWPCTCYPSNEVELVERATDEERTKMLSDVGSSSACDLRVSIAREQAGSTNA